MPNSYRRIMGRLRRNRTPRAMPWADLWRPLRSVGQYNATPRASESKGAESWSIKKVGPGSSVEHAAERHEVRSYAERRNERGRHNRIGDGGRANQRIKGCAGCGLHHTSERQIVSNVTQVHLIRKGGEAKYARQRHSDRHAMEHQDAFGRRFRRERDLDRHRGVEPPLRAGLRRRAAFCASGSASWSCIP